MGLRRRDFAGMVQQLTDAKAEAKTLARENEALRRQLADAEFAAGRRRNMTPEQVAEFYGVHLSTIYDWMKDGRLSYLEVNRTGRKGIRRIGPADIRRFEAAHARHRDGEGA